MHDFAYPSTLGVRMTKKMRSFSYLEKLLVLGVGCPGESRVDNETVHVRPEVHLQHVVISGWLCLSLWFDLFKFEMVQGYNPV